MPGTVIDNQANRLDKMTKELKWKHKRVFHIVGSILVLILGFYFKTTVDNSSFKIHDDDLTSLDGLVLASNPKYVERHGKGTHEHIEFQIKNYSKVFAITGFDYDCSVRDSLILNGIKTNDTISIKILKETYTDLKNDNISYTNIDIHSLIFKEQEYLNLNCRNQKQKKEGRFGVYMCFIMSPLLLISGLFRNEPKIGKIKIDLSLVLLAIMFVLTFLIPKFT
jgi:hypothetical protein